MRIIVRKEALDLYIKLHTDYLGSYSGTDKWELIMEQIAGETLEVDTKHLFKHEFNTKEIPGVSKKGIRISEEFVEQVIDDLRLGKARCEFCEQVSNSTQYCTHCGKADYLEPFFDED